MFPAPSPTAERTRLDHRLALLLALLAVLVHARALFLPFVNVGDPELVTENPFLGRPWNAWAWLHIWSERRPEGAIVLLESALWGRSALGYHLASVLLHSTSVVLLFLALRRMKIEAASSAFVAALFALHPVQVESVAWVARLGTLLAGGLFLAGLWLYSGYTAGQRFLVRSAWQGLFLAAFAVEPRLCLASILLLLLDRWPLARFAALPADERAIRRKKIALETLGLLPAGLLLFALPRGPRLPDELDLYGRLAHAPVALFELLAELFWPRDLAWFHPHPALVGKDLSGWLAGSWLVPALLAVALWRLRARVPYLSLGAAWFVLLVFPHFPFPSSEAFYASHWTYVGGIGIELAFVLGTRALFARMGAGTAPWIALQLAALAACAAVTWTRTGDWRSSRALHERALEVSGSNYRAHDGLALALVEEGRLSSGERALERALAIRPGDDLALLHRGDIELRRGLLPGQEAHFAEAKRYLERALASDPSTQEKLGEVLQRSGDSQGARRALEEAVRRDRSRYAAAARLGMVLLETQELEGARNAFERAVAIRPDLPDGWCGLGLVSFQTGALERAAPLLERTLAIEPDYVEARTTLGRILEQGGDRSGAEREYRRAVAVNPDYADGLFYLAALCDGDGRTDEARRLFERTVHARPSHLRARVALARILVERGAREEAVRHLKFVEGQNAAHVEANLLLGRLAHEAGNLDAARLHFERVLQVDAENFAALEGLARVQSALGRADEAEKLLLRALEHAPSKRRPALEAWLERLRRGETSAEGSGSEKAEKRD